MGIRARNMTEFYNPLHNIVISATGGDSLGAVPFDCKVSAVVIVTTATTTNNWEASIEDGSGNDLTSRVDMPPSPAGTVVEMDETELVAAKGSIITLDTDGTAPVAGTVTVWVVLRRIGAPGDIL